MALPVLLGVLLGPPDDGPPEESGTGDMPLLPELPPAGESGAAGLTFRTSELSVPAGASAAVEVGVPGAVAPQALKAMAAASVAARRRVEQLI